MGINHSHYPEPTTKANILGFFYRYPIKALPVVNKERRIIGLLHKENLTASATVTANLNLPLRQVVKEYLVAVDVEKDYWALQTLLANFKKLNTLPVIDLQGKVVDYWERVELICSWEGTPSIAKKEWANLFDAFPYPVIIIDLSNQIIYLNQPAEGLFITGRGRKIIGKSLPELISGLTIVENNPLLNQSIWIEGEAFSFDGVPINRGSHRIGTIYLLRRQEV